MNMQPFKPGSIDILCFPYSSYKRSYLLLKKTIHNISDNYLFKTEIRKIVCHCAVNFSKKLEIVKKQSELD